MATRIRPHGNDEACVILRKMGIRLRHSRIQFEIEQYAERNAAKDRLEGTVTVRDNRLRWDSGGLATMMAVMIAMVTATTMATMMANLKSSLTRQALNRHQLDRNASHL